MASKLCDSCKSATATIYCRPDAAFLCVNCDSRIHSANKLASRHPRVWMCEVCEQAPAHVTCRADAAALCVTCDRDIHSANPLASRHERVPVSPFYTSPTANNHGSGSSSILDDRYFPAKYGGDGNEVSGEEEEEAASWLLPNPSPKGGDGCGGSPEINTGQYIFSDMDPYLDLDYTQVDPKTEAQDQNSSGTDGVVPIQSNGGVPVQHMVNEHCYDLDFTQSKPYSYGYNCISQSVRPFSPI